MTEINLEKNSEEKAGYPIPRPPKKRRSKYSRNGCLECKRMKVKCDELKPSCTRCAKGSKRCNYNVLNGSNGANPGLKARVSKSPLSPKTDNKTNDINSIPKLTNIMDVIDHDIASKIDEILSKELSEHINAAVSPVQESELFSTINQESFNLISSYDQLDKPISKNEDLLLNKAVYSMPHKVFQIFNDLSHKCYFDIFYSKFSEILMPVTPEEDVNPIRDIILSYALRKNYLYNAILASGARISYKSTSLKDDQIHFSIFMQNTSQMLDDFTFLQNYKPNDESINDVIHQKLEPLLLTILLLTSDNAASLEQTWRGHLRGAKELLSKVYIDKNFPETKILLFCKCWFTSFEILAGLSAPYGGTLSNEKELEKLITNIDSPYEISTLKSLKLVDENGFNYLFGFHHDLFPAIFQLTNLMRLKSNFKDNKTSITSSEIFELINRINNSRKLTFKDKWKTSLHQAYSQAALLTILSKFLDSSPSNIIVAELVKSILSTIQMAFGPAKSTPYFQLLLFQWPILVAGLNCVADEDKFYIESLMKALVSLGTGSAKHALDKIVKIWNNELTMDEVDIVTY